MDDVKPWEQLEDESDYEYERFLVFLYLGPRRDCTKAARVAKEMEIKAAEHAARLAGVAGLLPPLEQPKNVNSRWRETAKKRNWRARASAWDAENFKTIGYNGLVAFAQAITEMATGLFERLPFIQYQSVEDYCRVMELLARLIPQDCMRDLLSIASRRSAVLPGGGHLGTAGNPPPGGNGYPSGQHSANGFAGGEVPRPGGVCGKGAQNHSDSHFSNSAAQSANGTAKNNGAVGT